MLCFVLVCAQTPHWGKLQYDNIASMREEPLSSGKGTQFPLMLGIHTHNMDRTTLLSGTHAARTDSFHARKVVRREAFKKYPKFTRNKNEPNKELTRNYL